MPSAFSAEATGATIDESKVANIYYVDAAGADAADDDQHGTQDSPFATLRRGLDAALRDKDAGIGAKVVIAAGIYHESIDIPAPARADTDAPLVIEAAERDQVIIDAADTAGWSADTWTKSDRTAWTHPWPFGNPRVAAPRGGNTHGRSAPAGNADPGAPLVFFNGLALRQTADPGSRPPAGAFALTRDPKSNNAVLVVRRPEESIGDDAPDDNQFQVGVRDHGMLVTGRRNVVVRGLLFQHAANPTGAPLAGLAFVGCSNVLVEDVLSQWNDGAGLLLKGSAAAPWSSGFTLRRVQLIHNGQSGLVAENLKNVLSEDCETSFNNFRDEWTATADPQGPAGLKARGLHGSAWRRHRAVANFSRGLWWSSDCTDLLVEEAVVRDNLFSGLFIENCPGPTVVRGSLIAGNKTLVGTRLETTQPAAVSVEASPDVTLENNVVAGNAMPQLGLRNIAERTDGTNFETGTRTTLRAERHVYRHNAFWGANADQVLVDLPVSDAAGKGDFAFYYGTLDSDENCFWNPASAEVFCTYDRTAYRRPGMSLAGWRTFLAAHAGTGGGTRKPEAGSLWQDPQFMEPAEGDYRLQSQSPLIDWGLPAEEGGAAQ